MPDPEAETTMTDKQLFELLSTELHDPYQK